MFFSQILDDMPQYRALCECVEKGVTPVHTYGMSGSQKSHLIYSLCSRFGKKCLVVAADETEAGRIKEDLSFLFCRAVFSFPSREYVFYDVDAANHGGEFARIRALHSISDSDVVVTTMKAMLQYTLPPELLRQYSCDISCGDIVEVEQFCRNLAIGGYKRVSTVEGVGQYSRRGSIIDVFCPLYTNPVRIELFDDEVDSLREFDKESQMSVKNIDSCTILPARELIYNEQQLVSAVDKIKKQKNENLNGDAEKLLSNHYIASGDKYMPFFYDEITTLADYMPEDCLVVYDEPTSIYDGAKSFCNETGEIIAQLLEKGLFPKHKKQYFLSYADVTSQLGKKTMLSMSALSYTTPEITPRELINVTAKSMQNYNGNLDFLIEDIKYWKNNNYRTIIVLPQKTMIADMHTRLDDNDIQAA
ncbi:MAG: hypothetical protein IJ365_02650, partial [Clostridia bacterium]|nr:hypothetical protein [Clostridia bacterium]